MKYKFTVIHKICIAIALFMLIFYIIAGYGPWDLYLYLLLTFLILCLLFIDLVIQGYRSDKK